ncbi:MAG: hypothetical protein WAN20_09275 [Pseudonocardiaceae bacterium]
MLDELFDPLTAQIARVEQDLYEDLAYPVSPRSATGWPDVDTEIKELRRRFASCSTPQDYRSLGTYCMGVIESVSRVAYKPELHVRDGETELPPDKTKLRLDRVVEMALPGRRNEELRSLAKAAVTAAHRVKHGTAPSRMVSGITCDAVILMANIIRRLEIGEGRHTSSPGVTS